MKNTALLKIFVTARLVFLISLLLHSCKKLDQPGNFQKRIVDYNLIHTRVSLKFIDAVSGKLIGKDGSRSVKVAFSGVDASKVIDISGLRPDFLNSQHGLLTFTLIPGELPKSSDPVNFSLTAELPGYLNAVKSFRISKGGNYFYEIRMMDVNNMPEGVSEINTEFIADTNGTITEDISVVTPDNRAILEIPAGAIFWDANGIALTGNLSLSLIHFSNVDDECLQAYPGGLQSSVLDSGGQQREVVFFPAGLNAIHIVDGSGRVAGKISGGLPTLRMNIPAQTSYFNREESQFKNISNGSELPLWFYDASSARWVFDTLSTVVISGPGLYTVSGKLDHLSWWAWNWTSAGDWCSDVMRINFKGDDAACNCYWVEAEIRNPHTGAFLWKEWMYVCGEETEALKGMPSGFPVEVSWSGYCNERVSTEAFYQYPDLCTGETAEVTWQGFNQGEGVDLEIVAHCPDEPEIEIRTNFGIWYRKANSWCWNYIATYQGKAKICDLEMGQDYVMAIVYNKSYSEYVFTPQYDAFVYQDIKLSAAVCNEVLGF
ncbi:MAG: hypothetical protein U5Q03_15525 [Bacteroidota bacterium]|nr:hypothetical protein [Bacteroidota bacterium]